MAMGPPRGRRGRRALLRELAPLRVTPLRAPTHPTGPLTPPPALPPPNLTACPTPPSPPQYCTLTPLSRYCAPGFLMTLPSSSMYSDFSPRANLRKNLVRTCAKGGAEKGVPARAGGGGVRAGD